MSSADSIVDELTNLALLVEDKTRSLIAGGRLQELDRAALAPVVRAADRLAAPAQELSGTLRAMSSNRSFQEMVDKFLSVDRKLSGIASDDEAAAIGRFRKAIVIVADVVDRIEVRSGVVDMFSVVIVRAGDALVRYRKVYNEFVGETRVESVSLNTDSDRKFVARDMTFWLDRDAGWTDIDGEEVDAALRAAVGRAADGVSDDSMVQMVYGALSSQIDDLNELPQSVLADATEFVLGPFTEAGNDEGGEDDDDAHGGHDDDDHDDDDEGNDDDDDDDDDAGQPLKRSKTDEDDDDGEA
jgi:hypothetical protein